jgi:hypothetical protein
MLSIGRPEHLLAIFVEQALRLPNTSMQLERLRYRLESLPKEEANCEAFSDSKSAFRNEQDENNDSRTRTLTS